MLFEKFSEAEDICDDDWHGTPRWWLCKTTCSVVTDLQN